MMEMCTKISCFSEIMSTYVNESFLFCFAAVASSHNKPDKCKKMQDKKEELNRTLCAVTIMNILVRFFFS